MIDFSKYSNDQLEQVLNQINAEKYPENLKACQDEIAKRKGDGRWNSFGEYISSSRAALSGFTFIIFQVAGILFALFAMILLFFKSHPGVNSFEIGFTLFTVMWNVLFFVVLKRFFSRSQNVAINEEGLNVFSISDERHSFVPFSDIREIRVFSQARGWFGPHAIYIRTNKSYHFGQNFYFTLKNKLTLETDFNIKNHPDYLRIVEATKKFNPNIINETSTSFIFP